MSNNNELHELVQKYKTTLADSQLNMEDVPYRSRGAMAIKKNDSISFLPGIKKQLLAMLLDGVEFKLVSGPVLECEAYAQTATNSGNLVLDAEELYAMVSNQVWDTVGHNKTFGSHQMHVFLQITNSLVQNVLGQGSFVGLSEEKFLSSRRECFEHVKALMESLGGLTLNRVYLESSIMQKLLDSAGTNVNSVSIVNVPAGELERYSTLLFGKAAQVVKLESTQTEAPVRFKNKKNKPQLKTEEEPTKTEEEQAETKEEE
jgi:hypothetical protein